jgi:recombination protein RecT
MLTLQDKKNLAFTAHNNPASLVSAILNVAAIGISLNPALKLAYLIPRDGRVVLDISYKGLKTLAEREGSIICANAELVFANDQFQYKGAFTSPFFEADVFATPEERGLFRGVFCEAILPGNQRMVEKMSANEIYKIRDMSKAFQNKVGPWISFFEEMVKKTVLKRAYKSWPAPERSRFAKAIQVLNEHEGLKTEFLDESSGPLLQTSSKSAIAYDEGNVSDDVKEMVTRIVNRTIEHSAWSAGNELIKDRYKGDDLHYATLQLTAAKQSRS